MFLQNSNSSKVLENVTQVNGVVQNSIENLINSILARLPYLIAGILILFIFWGISKIVRWLFTYSTKKTRLDTRLQVLFGRLISVCVLLLGFFTALTVIIPTLRFGDLISGLGFTSFVVGFATKDILNNLLSGVLILWNQPFRIGDYITIGANQGKVEHIGVRATRLRKDDGEYILIPNGDMYSTALTIRGAGTERRMFLSISVGYEADLAKAKEIILQILERSENVVHEPKPSVVVTDLTSDGVNVSVYFWVDTEKTRPQLVFDSIATMIKSELGHAGLEIYPPSSVVIHNPPSAETDSKPAAPIDAKKDEF